MTQLIRKGGFRERANRSARFTNSENQQTVLSTSMRQYLSAQDDTDVNATIAAVAETITEKSNSTNIAATTHTESCESSTQPYTTNKGGK